MCLGMKEKKEEGLVSGEIRLDERPFVFYEGKHVCELRGRKLLHKDLTISF